MRASSSSSSADHGGGSATGRAGGGVALRVVACGLGGIRLDLAARLRGRELALEVLRSRHARRRPARARTEAARADPRCSSCAASARPRASSRARAVSRRRRRRGARRNSGPPARAARSAASSPRSWTRAPNAPWRARDRRCGDQGRAGVSCPSPPRAWRASTRASRRPAAAPRPRKRAGLDLLGGLLLIGALGREPLALGLGLRREPDAPPSASEVSFASSAFASAMSLWRSARRPFCWSAASEASLSRSASDSDVSLTRAASASEMRSASSVSASAMSFWRAARPPT